MNKSELDPTREGVCFVFRLIGDYRWNIDRPNTSHMHTPNVTLTWHPTPNTTFLKIKGCGLLGLNPSPRGWK